jgi:hypothetical protein
MSHGTCPTVRVSDDGGSFVVINESDFNADEHELFDAAAPALRKGTTDWYKAELTAHSVEFDDDAKKADLKRLHDVMTANGD